MDAELVTELAKLGAHAGRHMLERWRGAQRHLDDGEFLELVVLTSAEAARRIIEKLDMTRSIDARGFTHMSGGIIGTNLELIREFTGKVLPVENMPDGRIDDLLQYVYDKMKGYRR